MKDVIKLIFKVVYILKRALHKLNSPFDSSFLKVIHVCQHKTKFYNNNNNNNNNNNYNEYLYKITLQYTSNVIKGVLLKEKCKI